MQQAVKTLSLVHSKENKKPSLLTADEKPLTLVKLLGLIKLNHHVYKSKLNAVRLFFPIRYKTLITGRQSFNEKEMLHIHIYQLIAGLIY